MASISQDRVVLAVSLVLPLGVGPKARHVGCQQHSHQGTRPQPRLGLVGKYAKSEVSVVNLTSLLLWLSCRRSAPQ